jgi:hypothetical protein
MHATGFETAIPATERQHTYVLKRSATGIGTNIAHMNYNLEPFYEFG